MHLVLTCTFLLILNIKAQNSFSWEEVPFLQAPFLPGVGCDYPSGVTESLQGSVQMPLRERGWSSRIWRPTLGKRTSFLFPFKCSCLSIKTPENQDKFKRDMAGLGLHSGSCSQMLPWRSHDAQSTHWHEDLGSWIRCQHNKLPSSIHHLVLFLKPLVCVRY